MPFRIEAIVPKNLDWGKEAEAAIQSALDQGAKEIQSQFQKTVATWKNRPNAFIRKVGQMVREIGINDERYGWVNDGTRPHIIRAKKRALAFNVPYGPKTQPRQIGSTQANIGATQLLRKEVHHPGTKAREFDEAIAVDVEKTIAQIFDDAFNSIG